MSKTASSISFSSPADKMPPADADRQSRIERALLLSVCITQFFCAFMGSSMNVASEAIALDFDVQPQYTAWVLTCFTACSASFLLTAAAAADRFGLRKVYTRFCLFCALSALMLAAVPDFTLLLAGRALQGVLFSFLFCTGVALLVAVIRKVQRARALAFSTAAVYAGLSTSPAAAGFMIDLCSWRLIFIAAAIGLTLAWTLARRVPATPGIEAPASAPKVNLIDHALSFCGLTLLLVCAALLSTAKAAAAGCILGLVLCICLLCRQRTAASPLLPLKLFKTSTVSWALSAAVCNYMSNFSVTFLLALYLQLIIGYTAAACGLILLFQPVAMMICTLLTARLSEHFKLHTLTTAGMLCITAAFCFYAALDVHTPLYQIILAQLITGIGFGLFSAPNTNLVMSSVKPEFLAVASSLLALSRNFGQALSMTIATLLLTHFIDALAGTTLYLYELGGSINICFTVSACLAFLGAVCSFCGRRHRPNHD